MVTSRYPYGGADQVAMTLVQGLTSRHEVTFITTGASDDAYDEDGHRRIVIGLEFQQLSFQGEQFYQVFNALAGYRAGFDDLRVAAPLSWLEIVFS